MTYIKEMWVLSHFDMYRHIKGKGYVPTEKATPEAIEAIQKINEFVKNHYSENHK